MIECAIHEDAVEPGAKVGALFELLEVQIRVQQAVLHDILRILFIAGHTKGEVVHVSAMTLDERQEHLQIAAVVHLTLLIGRLEKCAVNTRPSIVLLKSAQMPASDRPRFTVLVLLIASIALLLPGLFLPVLTIRRVLTRDGIAAMAPKILESGLDDETVKTLSAMMNPNVLAMAQAF